MSPFPKSAQTVKEKLSLELLTNAIRNAIDCHSVKLVIRIWPWMILFFSGQDLEATVSGFLLP